MTPRNYIVAAFFPVLLFLVPGESAAQQLVPYEVLGDWEVSYSQTPEGEFEVCMATKGYKNEEAVLFYSDGGFTLLGLFLERWQLDRSETYEVSIQIDDGTPIPTTAIAGEDFRSVLIDVDLTPHLTTLLQSSKLTVITGAGPVAFDISGAEPALRSMIRCIVENRPDASQ